MIARVVRLAMLLVCCLCACASVSSADQFVDIAGTRLDLFTYRPPGCTSRVVLVVFHGQSRNAWTYRDSMRFLADRFCGFVVAPEFDQGRFPTDLYQYGGVVGETAGRRTIDLVPPVVAWARGALGAPGLPFVLLGHSAGGQFLSRVAAFGPNGAAGLVIANPSTWVLPSTTVAAPFGLAGTEAATDEGLRAYLARPITVLLGTADVGGGRSLVTRPEAMAQGPNRYTRGVNTFEMARSVAAGHGWAFGWTLGEVPGVGARWGRDVAVGPGCGRGGARAAVRRGLGAG